MCEGVCVKVYVRMCVCEGVCVKVYEEVCEEVCEQWYIDIEMHVG